MWPVENSSIPLLARPRVGGKSFSRGHPGKRTGSFKSSVIQEDKVDQAKHVKLAEYLNRSDIEFYLLK
jgi:hypothetical protein